MYNGKFKAKLSLILVLFSFLYFFCITFAPIPESSTRIADTITGFLIGTVITTIIGFYFGSSDISPTKGQKEE